MAQIQATQQPPPTLVQPVKEESPQVNGHAEETSMETNEEEVTKEVINKSSDENHDWKMLVDVVVELLFWILAFHSNNCEF